MPGRGRPRVTLEVYEARLAAYCSRYKVAATREGLPPFPSGQRETPQHREWISLYKAHGRLARRARGVCERCEQPALEGSVFCATHKAESGLPGSEPAPPDERRELLKAQAGRCPVCDEKVAASDLVHRPAGHPESRALLHAPCQRLAGVAATAGPETLDRLRAYLWPKRKPRR
jgi:hypothetical protein